MKQLETDQDKIQQICEALRKDTLEPAEKQAAALIDEAKAEASRIILEAEKEAEKIVRKAQGEMDKERQVFEHSMQQAGKQGVEMLRQSIQETLFAPELEKLVAHRTSDGNVIAQLIDAIVKAVEKEGLKSDLTAYIPKAASPKEILALLTHSVSDKLGAHGIEVGGFKGGAKVKLVNRKMTIDMSDEALRDLLAGFISKDFRKWVFGQ